MLYRASRWLPSSIETLMLDQINPRGRTFIPPGVSVVHFFGELKRTGASYVVLRWFEDLPRLHAAHDLDLLADVDALDTVFSCLSRWPLGHPVDVHAVGAPGPREYLHSRRGAHRVLPCPFPSDRAERILSRRQEFHGLCFVPSIDDRFFALAAHVATNKSAAALAPQAVNARDPAMHDYAAKLRELAGAGGIVLDEPLTRQSLQKTLAAHGWSSP